MVPCVVLPANVCELNTSFYRYINILLFTFYFSQVADMSHKNQLETLFTSTVKGITESSITLNQVLEVEGFFGVTFDNSDVVTFPCSIRSFNPRKSKIVSILVIYVPSLLVSSIQVQVVRVPPVLVILCTQYCRYSTHHQYVQVLYEYCTY